MKKIITLIALFVFIPALPLSAAEGKSKPPFVIIYNNDTTNIINCPTWYNVGKDYSFTEEKIRANVDETADCGGVDVLMMASGMGWEPWWKSTALPMQQHTAWRTKRTGKPPTPFQTFVLQGGDLIDTVTDEARKKKQTVFVTYRMNDGHHAFGAARIKDPVERATAMAITQFYDENPQFLIGDVPAGTHEPSNHRYSMEFIHPQVREYRLQFIKELAQKDVDGIELDFMRFWFYFHPERSTSKQRADIMTQLVKEVRAALDAHAKPGQRRYLCVRIPAYLEMMDAIGIDPVRLAKEAGVDMFNISGHYHSDMQNEAAKIKKMLPENVAVYTELHYVNARQNRKIPFAREPDGSVTLFYDARDIPADAKTLWVLRRTSDQALITSAHMAYARGVDGLSFFNFQYYRGTRYPGDVYGTPHEPPYHLFKKLRDKEFVAGENQYYFLGYLNTPLVKSRPFHQLFKPGVTQTMLLDMAPPTGGWHKDGRLRIQSMESLKGSQWSVSFNGVKLEQTDDVSEPYPNPYDTGVGAPDNYKAFILPAALVKDGENKIAVTMKKGGAVRLFYLDIALPAGE